MTITYGNVWIPNNYISPNGYNLYKWTSHQRTKKSKNALNQNRIDRLETLTGWSWDLLSDKWEEGYEQLQYYIKEHGNARVSQKHISPNALNLKGWIGTQRTNKSNNLLSQDRIDRLEALIGWSWDALTDKWIEGLEQLICYAKEHGNARVSSRYVSPDGYKLGKWVCNQRITKAKNLISQDRIERLEALSGWVWSMKKG